jgi:crossover junction endodeoxyribonuclease RuvC
VVVIGIDPGTRHLGWGVVRGEGNRVCHLAHGVIDPDESQPLPQRLVTIEQGLCAVLQQYSPGVGSVESLFFYKDATAAAKLGHARGVVLLSLARAGVEVFEYAPARVKNTVTGTGRADKRQVARMVRAYLGLAEEPREDAADALALALTYLRRAPIEAVLGSAPRSGTRAGNAAALRLLSRSARRG